MSDNGNKMAASFPKLREWPERRQLPDGHPSCPAIFIRPLQMDDANTSCHWRNDPNLWRLTGNRPDRHITLELERKWLAEALSREDEKRFAICLKKDGRYIGNAFYTNILHHDAEPHIFIGEPEFWGRGIATDAVLMLLEHGFVDMGLDRIHATINSSNIAMVRMCQSLGHEVVAVEYDDKFKAVVTRLILTKRTFQAHTRLGK